MSLRSCLRGLLLTGLALGVADAAGAQQQGSVITNLTLFACTDEGAWRTDSWGRTWEPLRVQQTATVDPASIRPARVFHPLGPRVYLGGAGGVLVSDDFGATWRKLGFEGDAWTLLPSRYPQADPTLFVGGDRGLLRSPDAGETFDETALIDTRVYRVEWPGPALVAATDDGLLVSDDAGASFDAPEAGLPEGPVRAMALSSFFAVDPVLFVGVGEEGVFHSSDRGRTWQPAGLAGQRVNDLYWLGPFLYAATSEGFFRSQDLGKRWVALDRGLETAVPLRILFPLAPDSGAELFLGTSDGVFQSSDGGNYWRRAGLPGREVTCLATFPPPAQLRDSR